MCKISSPSVPFYSSYCTGIWRVEGYFPSLLLVDSKPYPPTPQHTHTHTRLCAKLLCSSGRVFLLCQVSNRSHPFGSGFSSTLFFYKSISFKDRKLLFYRIVWRLCHTHTSTEIFLITKVCSDWTKANMNAKTTLHAKFLSSPSVCIA